MAFDIIIPHGNEKELCAMASALGASKLLLLYEPGNVPASLPDLGIDVTIALLCTSSTAEKFLAGKHPVALVSSEHDKNIFERRNAPKYLLGLGESELSDKTHQRESGLNQPLLRELHKKGVTVVLSVDKLLSCSGQERARLMGRWMQNIILCRKYNVPILIASCASTPYAIRSSHDRQSTGIVLGMQPTEAAEPMTF